jgi:hypothetical protein
MLKVHNIILFLYLALNWLLALTAAARQQCSDDIAVDIDDGWSTSDSGFEGQDEEAAEDEEALRRTESGCDGAAILGARQEVFSR